VRATDWAARGLPSHMTLRTGLHAGPAYACVDPVTDRANFFGAHVSRAARIEPITPPGEVYASGEFAAIARTEHVTDFRCEYVGRTPLAKSYGTLPMYVLRRRAAAAGA
jgi:class 3 adenylate cyclase